MNVDQQIFTGDARELFAIYDDETFDLVVTSPPYNMNLRISGTRYHSRQIVKEISTKYASYDDNLPLEDYFEFLKQTISECLRVSKLTFFNIQMLTGNKPVLFRLLGEFHKEVKEVIIWDKVNAEPAIGEGVLNSQFEFVLVLSQHKDAVTRRFKQAQFSRGTLNNIWQIRRGKKLHPSHGAVFPEMLAQPVVENFSDKGDSVLDPFTGTGTTGVVCKKLDRDFVGFEIDEDYASFARERITETKPC